MVLKPTLLTVIWEKINVNRFDSLKQSQGELAYWINFLIDQEQHKTNIKISALTGQASQQPEQLERKSGNSNSPCIHSPEAMPNVHSALFLPEMKQ